MMLESIDRRFVDMDRNKRDSDAALLRLLDERAAAQGTLLNERASADRRLMDERAASSQRAIEALASSNEKALSKVDEKTEKGFSELKVLVAALQTSQDTGEGRRAGVSTLLGSVLAGIGTISMLVSVSVTIFKH